MACTCTLYKYKVLKQRIIVEHSPTHDSPLEKSHCPVLLTLLHVALCVEYAGDELQPSPAGQLTAIIVPTGAGDGTV